MSTVLKLRIPLCALSVILSAMFGCGDSSAPETAETETAGPDDPGETAPVETATADPLTPDEPMVEPATPDEPTEVAVATPADPMPPVVDPMPTVPATPDTPDTPVTPEEPEEIASLGIGDAAPPLAIDQWVMGEPIEELAAGQVYVVEFWATWCGPCLANMPHLAELQEHYGDEVQFVGVTREDSETVQGFLEREQSEGKTWNEVITYRLALDAGSATNAAYMQAAGQNGIPCAFIVGQEGIVEWIGHPAAMEETLAKVVTGDWDRAAAIAEFEQKQKLQELQVGVNGAARSGNWDEALSLIDAHEEEAGPSVQLSSLKMAVLQGAGKTEEVAAELEKLVDLAWDDAGMLNALAWNMASGRLEGDLELALRAAEHASELQDHEDASTLDTLARVHYELGHLDEAIEWQKKAVAQDADNETLSATLEQFEAELSEQAGSDEPSDTEGESATEEGEAASDEGEAASEEGEAASEEVEE